MASGKTFHVGNFKVNFSRRGIAAKRVDSDEVWRLPFPWAQPKPEREERYGGAERAERRRTAPISETYPGDYEDEPEEGRYGGVIDSAWLMWLMLILLPPLGIWLLWRQNRFELTIRSAVSASGAIWCVVLLIWMFSGLGGGRDQVVNNVITTRVPTTALPQSTAVTPIQPSIKPAPTPLVDVKATPSPTPLPSVISGDTDTQSGDEVQPTPTAQYVYCTTNGAHYHANATCSGMVGASRVLVSVAIARGKTACPVCLGGSASGDVTTAKPDVSNDKGTYFATEGGKFYHKLANCSGMVGATAISAAAAQARGQTACPICVGSVYATKDGRYYHSIPNCSGMKGATLVTIAKAKADGKKACPKCMKATSGGGKKTTSSNTKTASPTAKPGSTSSVTYYYATKDGKYYHKTATCSGMRGAVKITAAAAQARGKTPCPKCLGKADTTTYYYATSTGKYYHVKANCSGMVGASRITLAQAKARSQTPCPVCMKASAAKTASTATVYYSTKTGKYFHKTRNCSGMTGADQVTIAAIAARGQTACPKCLGSVAGYYATKTGKYYHKYATCSGMAGAVKVSAAAAAARGQKPCPVCLGGASSSSGGTAAKPTATPKPTSNERYYYGTPNGKYYHTKAHCSGMQHAVKVTLDQAKGKGQKPCPICAGGATPKPTRKPTATPRPKPTPTPKPTATETPKSNDDIMVWVTIEGNKYHSYKGCSGMKNAARTTLTWALEHNYKRCTVCDAPRPVS